MDYRIEHDSMGEVEVPMDCYWGAQTQRSLENFRIGSERLPLPLVRAIALIKQCASAVNCELGDLEPDLAQAATALRRECRPYSEIDKGDRP